MTHCNVCRAVRAILIDARLLLVEKDYTDVGVLVALNELIDSPRNNREGTGARCQEAIC